MARDRHAPRSGPSGLWAVLVEGASRTAELRTDVHAGRFLMHAPASVRDAAAGLCGHVPCSHGSRLRVLRSARHAGAGPAIGDDIDTSCFAGLARPAADMPMAKGLGSPAWGTLLSVIFEPLYCRDIFVRHHDAERTWHFRTWSRRFSGTGLDDGSGYREAIEWASWPRP